MNTSDFVPLHPMLVHVPLALSVLMPVISLGILIAWWRGLFPQRTWLVAVALQAMLVGGGYAALQSGEQDEEVVERVVSHDYIHEHEELAEVFLYAAAGVLVLMVVAMVMSRRPLALSTAALATVGTVAVLWFGYRTGEAGAKLVYQHGAASAFQGTAAPSGAAQPGTDHHEPPAQQAGGGH